MSDFEEYIKPGETLVVKGEVEGERESLKILTSLGTTKEFLGVEMALCDIKKLTDKDARKYCKRYQAILDKQVTGGLVELAINVSVKLIATFIYRRYRKII